MKKVIFPILLLGVCFCGGCTMLQATDAGTPVVTACVSSANLPTPAFVLHDPDPSWNDTHSLNILTDDLVQTEACATAISNAIVESVVGQQEWEALYLANVWDDVEHDVWVVRYDVRSDDPATLIIGGSLSIVIQKVDGKVIKIWGDE